MASESIDTGLTFNEQIDSALICEKDEEKLEL
jgi:hypothetical protein